MKKPLNKMRHGLNDPTEMNFDGNSELFFFRCSHLVLLFQQKNAKSSPRWQYNSMDIKRCKDLKIATDLIEDERDPDVIPAQYCESLFFNKFHFFGNCF